jgi:hypothetical protein
MGALSEGWLLMPSGESLGKIDAMFFVVNPKNDQQ